MKENLVAKKSLTINAPASKVWKALTDPSLIKQYLFGTETSSEWKKGSPITYKGTWEGKQYEDKGVIIDIKPEKLLHTTYLSSMSGLEDKPENYANVIYELSPENGRTTLTITQDNNKNEESLKHSEGNWGTVLNKLKEVVEK